MTPSTLIASSDNVSNTHFPCRMFFAGILFASEASTSVTYFSGLEITAHRILASLPVMSRNRDVDQMALPYKSSPQRGLSFVRHIGVLIPIARRAHQPLAPSKIMKEPV